MGKTSFRRNPFPYSCGKGLGVGGGAYIRLWSASRRGMTFMNLLKHSDTEFPVDSSKSRCLWECRTRTPTRSDILDGKTAPSRSRLLLRYVGGVNDRSRSNWPILGA